MRIGIDLRLLSWGDRFARRGIGRHACEQVRQAVRAAGGDHEFVLFCRRDADLAALDDEVWTQPGVSCAWMPALPAPARQALNESGAVLRVTAELQRAIGDQGLDVFHLTAPCQLEDLVPFRLDVCPFVATFDGAALPFRCDHDLVSGEEQNQAYARGIHLTAGAAAVLATSRWSAAEAQRRLGVDGSRIHVVYPALSPVGDSPAASSARLGALRERLDVHGRFVLCLFHSLHDKSLHRLFVAYAGVDPGLRRAHPLVLVCDLSRAEEATVRRLAAEHGIGGEVRLAGAVYDAVLGALHAAATLLVHPSSPEEFGLALLEAMAGGAAVIAERGTGIAELVGEAGLLVDASRPLELGAAIAGLLGDAGARRDLGDRARAQARRFLPEELGRRTLAVYGEAATTGRATASRVRIAMWTPVPPQRSGIADSSLALAGELQRWADVELFADDGVLPDERALAAAVIRHCSEFAPRHRQHPYDAVIYQLGVSFFHLYMLDAMRRWPGVATLHDLNWAALWHRLRSIWSQEVEFEAELRAAEGEEALQTYRQIRDEGGPELGRRLECFFDSHRMLAPLVQSSRAQIVYLPAAVDELAALGGHAVALGMGVEDPWRGSVAPESEDPCAAPRDFVVGAFGLVDPVKRIESVLQAVAALPDVQLRVVGAFATVEYGRELARLARQLGIEQRVQFCGRLAHEAFLGALRDCTVVVNLRHPFRHQMSGTLMRAIAAGKPVLIPDERQWGFLPASFCFRVPTGPTEVETLIRLLQRLRDDPAASRQAGRSARQYYESHATLARLSDGYRRVLAEAGTVDLPAAASVGDDRRTLGGIP